MATGSLEKEDCAYADPTMERLLGEKIETRIDYLPLWRKGIRVECALRGNIHRLPVFCRSDILIGRPR
jgi:hypothetical protein